MLQAAHMHSIAPRAHDRYHVALPTREVTAEALHATRAAENAGAGGYDRMKSLHQPKKSPYSVWLYEAGVMVPRTMPSTNPVGACTDPYRVRVPFAHASKAHGSAPLMAKMVSVRAIMAGSVVTPSCNARFVAAAVSKRAVTFILLRPQYRRIYPSRENRAVRVVHNCRRHGRSSPPEDVRVCDIPRHCAHCPICGQAQSKCGMGGNRKGGEAIPRGSDACAGSGEPVTTVPSLYQ